MEVICSAVIVISILAVLADRDATKGRKAELAVVISILAVLADRDGEYRYSPGHCCRFQSSRSLRTATCGFGNAHAAPHGISILAVLADRDVMCLLTCAIGV